MLDEFNVPYIALDTDPDVVPPRAGRAGRCTTAMPPTTQMLQHVGLSTMRALIATMDAPERIEAVVATARAERGDLIIVARARDAAHAARLYQVGATRRGAGNVEASLQLSEAVLVDLGVPMGPVIAAIHDRARNVPRGSAKAGAGRRDHRALPCAPA